MAATARLESTHLELGRRPRQPASPGKVERESGYGSFGSNQAGASVGPLLSEGFLLSATVVIASLVRAYRETNYRVHDAKPLTLRVDQPCRALAAAHGRYRTDGSAFLDATNRFSADVGEPVNAWLHANLGPAIVRRGLVFIAGASEKPNNG